jgi:hypothetical protein
LEPLRQTLHPQLGRTIANNSKPIQFIFDSIQLCFLLPRQPFRIRIARSSNSRE